MNLELVLRCCLAEPRLHARWLNTLAYLENMGARRMKRYESDAFVTLATLRHGAEEARHAYFLKSLIPKLGFDYTPGFTAKELFAPRATRHYIPGIDLEVSRALKTEYGPRLDKIRRGAYLLVTFAIETRAKMLYPIYDELLKEFQIPFSMKNILAEEDQHLNDMSQKIKLFFGPQWRKLSDIALSSEGQRFHAWQTDLGQDIHLQMPGGTRAPKR